MLVEDFLIMTNDRVYELATGEDIFDGLCEADLSPIERERISDIGITSTLHEDQ